MYLLNKRTPAFSIIEMLVVMLLSSLIVGIIYFAYYTVNGYQLTLTRKLQQVDDVAGLYYNLKADLDRSENVYMSGQGIVCNFRQVGSPVEYSFFSEFIIRSQASRTDTLKCAVEEFLFYFQGESATLGGTVDEVWIIIKSGNESVSLHMGKEYDAAALVNQVTKDSLP